MVNKETNKKYGSYCECDWNRPDFGLHCKFTLLFTAFSSRMLRLSQRPRRLFGMSCYVCLWMPIWSLVLQHSPHSQARCPEEENASWHECVWGKHACDMKHEARQHWVSHNADGSAFIEKHWSTKGCWIPDIPGIGSELLVFDKQTMPLRSSPRSKETRSSALVSRSPFCKVVATCSMLALCSQEVTSWAKLRLTRWCFARCRIAMLKPVFITVIVDMLSSK